MKLTVNGETREVIEGQTVQGLIEVLGIKGRAVAVEVNRELVPRRQHAQRALQAGDVVEVVTLVGGG